MRTIHHTGLTPAAPIRACGTLLLLAITIMACGEAVVDPNANPTPPTLEGTLEALGDPPREENFSDEAPEEPSFEHPVSSFSGSLFWGGGSKIDRWWFHDKIDMWSWTWASEPIDHIDVIAQAVLDWGFYGFDWDVQHDATEASVWFQWDTSNPPGWWIGDPPEFFQQFGDHQVEDGDWPTLDGTILEGGSCDANELCHRFFSYAARWEP